MADVLGRTPAELRRRVGRLSQVARVDQFVEADGPARGARRLRMVNGGGIELEVHPDRCLDLGAVTVGGLPLSWTSASGMTAPAAFEADGDEWLRTFGGGLLATCGLDTFGPPSRDRDTSLGLHGRVGAQPAELTRCEATATEVVVEGRVRQAKLFGENLVLHRRISSELGSDRVVLRDVVTNEGFDDSPHMILYHVNLGWPLLDEDAVLRLPAATTVARDEDARAGLDAWQELTAPRAGWREQVYRHEFGDADRVAVGIDNARLGLSLELEFATAQLPWLYQWKMLGEGAYVVGLEPTNCGVVGGRAAARAAGQLPTLAAGESVTYELAFVLRRAGVPVGAERKSVAA